MQQQYGQQPGMQQMYGQQQQMYGQQPGMYGQQMNQPKLQLFAKGDGIDVISRCVVVASGILSTKP